MIQFQIIVVGRKWVIGNCDLTFYRTLHFPHIYKRIGWFRSSGPGFRQGDAEANRRDLFAHLAALSSPEKMAKHGHFHRASRKITLTLTAI